MKKWLLIGLLVLLAAATVVAVVTLDHWSGNVNESAALLQGANRNLTQALIGLAAFVILGLFGIVFKGPKR